MRLTGEQKNFILQTVGHLLGNGAAVYLFGSRLDERSKGGDVDLFIEIDMPVPFLQQAKLKLELENRLGLPVDLIVKTRAAAPTSFQTIARAHAARLEN